MKDLKVCYQYADQISRGHRSKKWSTGSTNVPEKQMIFLLVFNISEF
jgi:hypothetical protein